MKNGFYFKSEDISSEYFLLKKLQLIEVGGRFDQSSQVAQYLQFHEQKYSFCSLFDHDKNADYILIFNSLTAERLIELRQFLKMYPHQKVLFIAHILFDYQSALDVLLQSIPSEQLVVLVDNQKHPYIVSEVDILELNLKKLSPVQILIYNKKIVRLKASKAQITFDAVFRHMIFFLIKILLKPKQFFHDFFATYNARYIYGQIKVFTVKSYFSVRHLSVMSMIRFVYGLKVLLIRFFYWCIEKVKMFFLNIFYGSRHIILMTPIYLTRFYFWCVEKIKMFFIHLFYGLRNIIYGLRHLTIMSVIHFFYGLKVFLIRSFYRMTNLLKRLFLWLFFKTRHLVVMSGVRSYYFVRHLLGSLKIFSVRFYFFCRHIVVMTMIRLTVAVKVVFVFLYYKFLAIINYSRGYIIWFYYRLLEFSGAIRFQMVRFYYFNFKYTFYPFRKAYWFLQFQYQTRILKRRQ